MKLNELISRLQNIQTQTPERECNELYVEVIAEHKDFNIQFGGIIDVDTLGHFTVRLFVKGRDLS